MSGTRPERGGHRAIVDLHCHVLPGVDDGSPDLETSLAFLRAARDAGTTDVVATPHQHPGRYPNPGQVLRDAHARLQEEVHRVTAAGEALPRVHLGAEVHLDAGLRELVAAGERLTLAGGTYLLLELPDVFPPAAVEETVYQLQLEGITPVLAHPERVGQLARHPEQYARLVERGVLGQVTGSSIAGDFGEPCRALTAEWVAAGLVHAVASDAHDLRRRPPALERAWQAVMRDFGEDVARDLLETRPRAILEGRELPPAAAARSPRADAPPARSWWHRLLQR